MRTFVIGDIHGAYKALIQCFKLSGFNYGQDRLVALGDVCDGYPEVSRCFDELLKVKHCDYLIGNHDLWALQWATEGYKDDVWLTQGGRATIASYGGQPMPKAHIDLLKGAHLWLEENGRVFVHAGFNAEKPISAQDKSDLVWERTLIKDAARISKINPGYQFGKFKEIYLGHTPTQTFQSDVPCHMCNVWAMDTGAGWGGRLSIMDVDTKKYWQSDLASELYPDSPVRK